MPARVYLQARGNPRPFAVVDKRDLLLVAQHRWDCKKGYAATRIGGRWRYMHHLVLGLADGEVDHRNGNPLDNRRRNLRPCSRAENLWNRPRYRNNTSGYKGVTYCRTPRLWRAQIAAHGKRYYLGYFKSARAAARAYDAAARELHGEFARVNFPRCRK